MAAFASTSFVSARNLLASSVSAASATSTTHLGIGSSRHLGGITLIEACTVVLLGGICLYLVIQYIRLRLNGGMALLNSTDTSSSSATATSDNRGSNSSSFIKRQWRRLNLLILSSWSDIWTYNLVMVVLFSAWVDANLDWNQTVFAAFYLTLGGLLLLTSWCTYTLFSDFCSDSLSILTLAMEFVVVLQISGVQFQTGGDISAEKEGHEVSPFTLFVTLVVVGHALLLMKLYTQKQQQQQQQQRIWNAVMTVGRYASVGLLIALLVGAVCSYLILPATNVASNPNPNPNPCPHSEPPTEVADHISGASSDSSAPIFNQELTLFMRLEAVLAMSPPPLLDTDDTVSISAVPLAAATAAVTFADIDISSMKTSNILAIASLCVWLFCTAVGLWVCCIEPLLMHFLTYCLLPGGESGVAHAHAHAYVAIPDGLEDADTNANVNTEISGGEMLLPLPVADKVRSEARARAVARVKTKAKVISDNTKVSNYFNPRSTYLPCTATITATAAGAGVATSIENSATTLEQLPSLTLMAAYLVRVLGFQPDSARNQAEHLAMLLHNELLGLRHSVVAGEIGNEGDDAYESGAGNGGSAGNSDDDGCGGAATAFTRRSWELAAQSLHNKMFANYCQWCERMSTNSTSSGGSAVGDGHSSGHGIVTPLFLHQYIEIDTADIRADADTTSAFSGYQQQQQQHYKRKIARGVSASNTNCNGNFDESCGGGGGGEGGGGGDSDAAALDASEVVDPTQSSQSFSPYSSCYPSSPILSGLSDRALHTLLIEDMLVYLLVWGEAANLRHAPECLCYLYHQCMLVHVYAQYRPAYLTAKHKNIISQGTTGTTGSTGTDNMSGSGYIRKIRSRTTKTTADASSNHTVYTSIDDCFPLPSDYFLTAVITPLYKTITSASSSQSGGVQSPGHPRHYDDWNEFFWSRECLSLGIFIHPGTDKDTSCSSSGGMKINSYNHNSGTAAIGSSAENGEDEDDFTACSPLELLLSSDVDISSESISGNRHHYNNNNNINDNSNMTVLQWVAMQSLLPIPVTAAGQHIATVLSSSSAPVSVPNPNTSTTIATTGRANFTLHHRPIYSKTFLEKRSWLHALYSFHRLIEVHILLFAASAIISFSEALYWGPRYTLHVLSSLGLVLNCLHILWTVLQIWTRVPAAVAPSVASSGGTVWRLWVGFVLAVAQLVYYQRSFEYTFLPQQLQHQQHQYNQHHQSPLLRQTITRLVRNASAEDGSGWSLVTVTGGHPASDIAYVDNDDHEMTMYIPDDDIFNSGAHFTTTTTDATATTTTAATGGGVGGDKDAATDMSAQVVESSYWYWQFVYLTFLAFGVYGIETILTFTPRVVTAILMSSSALVQAVTKVYYPIAELYVAKSIHIGDNKSDILRCGGGGGSSSGGTSIITRLFSGCANSLNHFITLETWRYIAFWMVLLVVKTVFGYYVVIAPLIPSSITLYDDYMNGLSLSLQTGQSSTVYYTGNTENSLFYIHPQIEAFLLFCLGVFIRWFPHILVYFLDMSIWFAIWSSLVGGGIALVERQGAVRDSDASTLRNHFIRAPLCFCQKLLHVPAQSVLRVHPATHVSTMDLQNMQQQQQQQQGDGESNGGGGGLATSTSPRGAGTASGFPAAIDERTALLNKTAGSSGPLASILSSSRSNGSNNNGNGNGNRNSGLFNFSGSFSSNTTTTNNNNSNSNGHHRHSSSNIGTATTTNKVVAFEPVSGDVSRHDYQQYSAISALKTSTSTNALSKLAGLKRSHASSNALSKLASLGGLGSSRGNSPDKAAATAAGVANARFSSTGDLLYNRSSNIKTTTAVEMAPYRSSGSGSGSGNTSNTNTNNNNTNALLLTDYLGDVRSQRWAAFSVVWNELIYKLRATDHVSNQQRDHYLFSRYEWLDMTSNGRNTLHDSAEASGVDTGSSRQQHIQHKQHKHQHVYLPLFQTAEGVERAVRLFKSSSKALDRVISDSDSGSISNSGIGSWGSSVSSSAAAEEQERLLLSLQEIEVERALILDSFAYEFHSRVTESEAVKELWALMCWVLVTVLGDRHREQLISCMLAAQCIGTCVDANDNVNATEISGVNSGLQAQQWLSLIDGRQLSHVMTSLIAVVNTLQKGLSKRKPVMSGNYNNNSNSTSIATVSGTRGSAAAVVMPPKSPPPLSPPPLSPPPPPVAVAAVDVGGFEDSYGLPQTPSPPPHPLISSSSSSNPSSPVPTYTPPPQHQQHQLPSIIIDAFRDKTRDELRNLLQNIIKCFRRLSIDSDAVSGARDEEGANDQQQQQQQQLLALKQFQMLVKTQLEGVLSAKDGYFWDDAYASYSLDQCCKRSGGGSPSNAGSNVTGSIQQQQQQQQQQPQIPSHMKQALFKAHGLLVLRSAQTDLPLESEARRRTAFFINSLFMDIPLTPSVIHCREYSVMTPYYSEDVLLSREDLERRNSEGTSTLLYLQTLHRREWNNYLERMGKDLQDRPQLIFSKHHRPKLLNESGSGQGSISGREVMDQGYTFETHTRIWASLRAQTLFRTVEGMMQTQDALRALRSLEDGSIIDLTPGGDGVSAGSRDINGSCHNTSSYSDIEKLIRLKFNYVIACQVYGDMRQNNDPKAQDIEMLLERHPNLRLAYIDKRREQGKVKGGIKTGGVSFYSVLVKYDDTASDSALQLQQQQSFPSLQKTPSFKSKHCIKEVYRVKLPGNPILGEGKPENQNHALIFTRGRYLQAVDMNQDGFFEESLKMRNLLQEFQKPEVAIVGFREHIFTGSVSSVASYMALQELSFVTLGQRVLYNPLRVRQHYGHPDVFSKLFVMTQGGMSKASRGINLSEDIFAGFNATLRGKAVVYREFLQVGKGRDVGLQQTYKFEAKLAQGNAEQSLSRDLHRICNRLDFFRLLSFYYGGIAHYMTNTMIMIAVAVVMYINTLLVLYNAESIDGRAIQLTSTLTMMLAGMGLLQTAPLAVTLFVEKGASQAATQLAYMILSGGPLYFIFQIMTRAHYFQQTLMAGNAKYRPTGRGFVIIHASFDENFRFFASSHLYWGFELVVLLVLYWHFSTTLNVDLVLGKDWIEHHLHNPDTGAVEQLSLELYAFAIKLIVYIGETWCLWMVAISFLLSPFWFNPLSFEPSTLWGDYSQWMSWVKGSGGSTEQSWLLWWREENAVWSTLSPSWKVIMWCQRSLLWGLIGIGLVWRDFRRVDMNETDISTGTSTGGTVALPIPTLWQQLLHSQELQQLSQVLTLLLLLAYANSMLSTIERHLSYASRRVLSIFMNITAIILLIERVVHNLHLVRYLIATYFIVSALAFTLLLMFHGKGSRSRSAFTITNRVLIPLYHLHDRVLGFCLFVMLFFMAYVMKIGAMHTWLLYHDALSAGVVMEDILDVARRSQTETATMTGTGTGMTNVNNNSINDGGAGGNNGGSNRGDSHSGRLYPNNSGNNSSMDLGFSNNGSTSNENTGVPGTRAGVCSSNNYNTTGGSAAATTAAAAAVDMTELQWKIQQRQQQIDALLLAKASSPTTASGATAAAEDADAVGIAGGEISTGASDNSIGNSAASLSSSSSTSAARAAASAPPGFSFRQPSALPPR